MTDLMTLIFGSYTPPDVPGRLITTDDDIEKTKKYKRGVFKEHGKNGGHHRVRKATENAERIRIHLMSHPWSTAPEICSALGLSKSPVYKHLLNFHEQAQVEVRKRQVGSYMMISYKWITEK